MSSTMSSSNLELDSMAFIPELDETPMTLEEILSIDLTKSDEELRIAGIVNDDFNTDFLVQSDDSNSQHLCVKELPYVRTQVHNAKQPNIDSGNPTSIICSRTLLAVGTFHGHILIFDNQRVRMFLKHETDFGTISAMAINPDETRLLCGGGKGSVSLWNLESGEMLRVVDNIHASFSSVIVLKYASDSNYAVLADTSGSVFCLDTRKKDFESNCVFTGSRGEVLAVQPLILNKKQEKDAFFGIEPVCMVAMATVSKVIVVSLRPNLFVHFTFQLKSSPEFLPLLAWNFTFKLEKPHLLLMFGRENQVYIHHVDTSSDEKIAFHPFYQFKTPGYTIQNMSWIEEDTMLLLDTNEKCHLLDFGDELATIDISQVELVYERANYKSLINGGLVSKAMAKAGEHACGNSITVRHTASRIILYFLGLKTVYEMKLQTWQERTEFFIQAGNPLRALQVTKEELSFINADDEKTRLEILGKLGEALESFENVAFERGLSKSKDRTKIGSVLKVILEYMFVLKDKVERVQQLFDRLEESLICKEVLIECLEEYIFSNQLTNLNPVLIKEIVDYYLAKDWIDLLDGIIVRFDIINLDLNNLMSISLDKGLYDSYLYVNNVAFQEYVQPFNELLTILNDAICGKDYSSFTKSDILLGNKMLVYLCSILTCCNYPDKGSIENGREDEHLDKIYDRLMLCDSTGESDVLNILFKFDPVEYLNVVLIAFEYIYEKHPQAQWKQNLIDFYIVRILIQEEKFNSEQRNAFFIFLARCLVTFANVEMSKNHFLMLVNCLFADRSAKKFDERQQILIQLYSHSFRKQFYPESEFLKRAFDAQMFRVCDFIHRLNSDWNPLFQVYLIDDEKKEEVFDYIHYVISIESLPANSRKVFLELVFDNYLRLIQIDSVKAANLFFAHFDGDLVFYEKLLENLSQEPKCLFDFLSFTIYQQREKFTKSPDEVQQTIHSLCMNAHYQELCVELACKLESPSLISFIQLFSEADKSKMLESCQKWSMREGEAMIFESLNQHSKSFEILFNDLKQHIDDSIKLCFGNIQAWEGNFNFDIIEKRFEILLNLCVRSFKNSVAKSNQFCLQILEYLIETNTNLNKIENGKLDKLDSTLSILHLQQHSGEASTLAKIFNKNFRNIFEQLLNTMINWMNSVEFFAVIRNKILQQSEDFMDLREILLCILENYHYESNLLELTRSILSHEQHGLMNRFHNSTVRSRSIQSYLCNICNDSVLTTHFGGEKNNIILYGCKHVYHRTCHNEKLQLTGNNENNGRNDGNSNDKNYNNDHDSFDSLPCPLCKGIITQNDSNGDKSCNDDCNDDEESNEIIKLLKSLGPQKVTKIELNASQYRALNHFHNDRFRIPKSNFQM